MSTSAIEAQDGRTQVRIAAAVLLPGLLASVMLAALAGVSSLGLHVFAIPFAAMLVLRVAHPPAAAGAAMIGLQGADWMFLADGILPAVAIVLAIALAAGALIPRYEYQVRWR
ncbi:hypothetical protein [Agromyces bauzanensis]